MKIVDALLFRYTRHYDLQDIMCHVNSILEEDCTQLAIYLLAFIIENTETSASTPAAGNRNLKVSQALVSSYLSGYTNITDYLLREEIENLPPGEKELSLMKAIKNGHLDIALRLAACQLDINWFDPSTGDTILIVAVKMKCYRILVQYVMVEVISSMQIHSK